jgi:enoyl-CoA hydratase
MKNLIYSSNNQIATITINRPDKMNALNIATIKEIDEAMQKALNDTSIRGIIITGSGEKAFVAGADIAEFAMFTPEQGKQLAAEGHRVFNSIANATKPVLAAINGFALGGGCELAIACHLRIASTNARIGQPEVNLGILPGYGGTQRLAQLIGPTKAMELLLTADMITADQALALGLVNQVCAQDQLLAQATAMLEKIATKGPIAVAKIIACVQAIFNEKQDGYAMEIAAFGDIMATSDFKEGTTAFIEKRKANFTGQ